MEQNLSLYKVFHTVAGYGNISKASKALYISQPALSKSISKLEESLGVKLFRRGPRGVMLTEEGKVLYEYTTTAFSSLDQAEEKLGEMQGKTSGSLRLGVSTTLCKYILLPFLQQFLWKYPGIRITIHCQSTFQTIRLLERNELDIGLIGRPDQLGNIDFTQVAVITDAFVSTDSYLDRLPRVSRPEEIFQSANVMLLDRENISRVYVDRYLASEHLEMNEILEISNMDLLIEFAKLGLGVACVIRNFVEKDLETGVLTEVPLPVPIPPREIGFARNRNAVWSDAAKTFVDFYENREKQ